MQNKNINPISQKKSLCLYLKELLPLDFIPSKISRQSEGLGNL
jgi:hypothetical protein